MQPTSYTDGCGYDVDPTYVGPAWTNQELAMRFFPKCEACRQLMIRVVVKMNDKAFADMNAHRESPECATYRKPKKGNGTYSGPFAFTLTMSPKDALTKSDLIRAARKIMGQKSCPAIRYAWHYEDKGVDPDGNPIHPHVHGMYETASGGRIEAKHFKRAWKIWDESSRQGLGFRGGYHRPAFAEEGYLKYIAEDGKESEYYNIDGAQESSNGGEEAVEAQTPGA